MRRPVGRPNKQRVVRGDRSWSTCSTHTGHGHGGLGVRCVGARRDWSSSPSILFTRCLRVSSGRGVTFDPDPIWFLGHCWKDHGPWRYCHCRAVQPESVMKQWIGTPRDPCHSTFLRANPNLYRAAMSLRVRCTPSVIPYPLARGAHRLVRLHPGCVGGKIEPGQDPVPRRWSARPCTRIGRRARASHAHHPNPNSDLW